MYSLDEIRSWSTDRIREEIEDQRQWVREAEQDGFGARGRQGWPSSTSSRASTTLTDDILRWTMSRRSAMRSKGLNHAA